MSANASPDASVDAEATTPAAAPTVQAPDGRLKELRLGLVCYGGVSLAIYMHGMTKEMHRAIRASVLEERRVASDADAKSELAYRRLLGAMRDEQKVDTRIVVDAIAGSSAGGINGIFLAKALAHDLSQDGLRDLWFVHGDLGEIVRRPERLDRIKRTLADAVIRGDEDDVPSEETKEKLLVAALDIRRDTLLEGDEMTKHIYNALAGMERDEQAPPPELASLMPARHLLELVVTVTDHWGYPRRLPITDPPVVAEAQHRHLLEFRYRSDQRDDFTRTENGPLTLAARATSSLPVGFQPVHVGGFPKVLNGATTKEDVERFFRDYGLAGALPERAHLVDGGVLDNKPFGPVLRAIRSRHAANEVDRYLIFLEPDPGGGGAQKDEAPKPIAALLGALSGLPRGEPILDELHDLLLRNERVRAVRDTIEANWTPVETIVTDKLENLGDPPKDPTDTRLADWNKLMHEQAEENARLTYPTYLRLKVLDTIDTFARAACLACDYTDASNQALLVRGVIRAWADGRELFEHKGSPTPVQQAFIADFDLGFPERRLRFVIAGVSWLYRDVGKPAHPSRQQLDAVKERLYEAVAKLEWLSSGRGFADEVLGGVQTCFGEKRLNDYLARRKYDVDPAELLAELSDDLNKLNAALKTFLKDERKGFGADLYVDLLRLTDGWPEKLRRDLLVRYLGFPIWDSMLYPLQALSDVAERDAVRVARMSPLDSKLLTPVHPEAEKKGKVMGADLGHAYAFFSLRAREHDYLWGRLDAAERMVGLLLTRTVVENGKEKTILGRDHADFTRHCKEVFEAVLEEDEAHLPTIADEVEKLKQQVAGL